MITLTRSGLTLSISEGMIPAQGSQNVQVRYVNDADEYANYLITPVVGWTERNGLCKSSIAEYSDGIVKLPARAFAQSCMASIAIKMTDPSDPTHVEVTYPQSFFIEKAPDGTLILPPTDEEWKQYIDDFVTQYFNQNIDPEMDAFKAEIIQDQTDFKEQMNEDFDKFIERTDGNPDALYRGYLVSKNNVYNGVASNDGINLGKVVGKSIQNGTPTPDSPVEIENVEITKLTSHTKNIINIDEIDKYYQSNNANTNTYKITGLLKDTNYTMSSDVPFTSPATLYFNGVTTETNGVSINKPRTFKSTTDGELIFHIRIDSQSGYKLQDFKDKKYYIQLELGDIATTYVDGDLSTTSTDLTLRSLPNGVADTYENGVITRRVGVATFDGSSDEDWGKAEITELTNTVRFDIQGLPDAIVNGDGLCNIFIKSGNSDNSDNEHFRYSTVVNTALCIFVNKSRLSTQNEAGFKTWLQSNPITVEYQLATPTIEYINIPTLPSYYPNTVACHNSEVDPTEIEWHVETEKGLENTYMPSLTINSDFQISQRGKSEYVGISGTNTYTVDMWRISGSDAVSLSVKEDYITIKSTNTSGNYLGITQIVNLVPKDGDKYTLLIKLKNDNTDYVFTTSPTNYSEKSQKEFGKFFLRLYRKSDTGEIVVEIVLKYQTSIDIEYIRLYEGSIAYKGQKEDYATALMRCLFYLRKFNNNFELGLGYQEANRDSVVLRLPVNMANDNVIVNLGSGWSIINVDTGSTNNATDLNVITSYSAGYVTIIFKLKNTGSKFSGNAYIFSKGNDGIIISCEQL